MKLLEAIKNLPAELNDKPDNDFLYSEINSLTREEIVYRKNGKSIDKIIEFDSKTNSKIKTTHYDYFNDKKIRSIDEYDRKSGKKIRTINYVLYKSIDEYDLDSGKKFRTINFNIKDDSKISSIQEYDIDTGKIITISIYKRDGKTISTVKRIDPITEKITNWVNSKTSEQQTNIYPVKSYENIKPNKNKDDIAKLIDNLYRNNIRFENIG